jgi:hypothetical protein
MLAKLILYGLIDVLLVRSVHGNRKGGMSIILMTAAYFFLIKFIDTCLAVGNGLLKNEHPLYHRPLTWSTERTRLKDFLKK